MSDVKKPVADPVVVPSGPLAGVLSTTDGSPAAANAVARAIEIAAAHGATLDLLHAADPELMGLEPGVHERECDRFLAPLVAKAEAAGVAVSSHVVAGLASRVIVDQAEELGVDLVVTGTRGLTAFDRIVLGSVADRVIRRLDRPVMVVHPEDTAAIGDPRSAVVAVDFSPQSALAVATAVQLLGARGGPATLELVHAAGAKEDAAEIRARLLAMAEPVAADGLTVVPVVEDAYPVALVDREAQRIGADFVVVGTRGRHGLEQFILGSVAERIVQHAGCPVVVVGT